MSEITDFKAIYLNYCNNANQMWHIMLHLLRNTTRK